MKKSVLIAPNAFKECAGSVEAAEIIKSCFNTDEYDLYLLPLSDGGDGFLEVCSLKFKAKIRQAVFPAPNGETQIVVPFAIRNGIVYIESAKVVGLNLISPEARDPLYYNTAGLGLLLKYISDNISEVREVIVGIGGTGTNDFGIGAASAFGIKLLNKDDIAIAPLPINFLNIKKIIYPTEKPPFKIKAVVDVNNQLLGELGATRMFARQKGASDDDIILMEKGFENICSLLERDGLISSAEKLSGAGGGLAAGLQAFFGAQVVFSKDFIINDLELKTFEDMDIVITGEGRFDKQSLMNKAPGVIVHYFKDSHSRVFIICGSAEENIQKTLPGNVKVIEMQEFFDSTEDSIKNFVHGISLACGKLKTLI